MIFKTLVTIVNATQYWGILFVFFSYVYDWCCSHCSRKSSMHLHKANVKLSSVTMDEQITRDWLSYMI